MRDKTVKTLTIFSAIAIAAIFAEIVLRVFIQNEIFNQVWFTSHVSRIDKKYGVLFRPNYNGYMARMADLPVVPLKLDRNGFRCQAQCDHSGDNPQRIVFLGGRSMMFGYGLPDQDTIHWQACNRLNRPAIVHNLALPGVDLHRNFLLYQEHFENKNHAADLAIIVVYEFKSLDNNVLTGIFPDSLDYLPKHNNLNKSRIVTHDGTIIEENVGTVSEKLGKYTYNSILLTDIAIKLDRLSPNILFSNFAPLSKSPISDSSHMDKSTQSAITRSDDSNMQVTLREFRNYILLLEKHFADEGTDMLVVFSPFESAGGPDYYKHAYDILPASINKIDLQNQLFNFKKKKWIAHGHYSKEFAAEIGKQIAGVSNQILQHRR